MSEFFRVLTWSALVFLIVSIVFTLVAPAIGVQEWEGKNVVRAFYAQKNTYGRFLYFAMLFIFVFGRDAGIGRMMRLLALGLCLAMLWLSGSRTALGVALATMPLCWLLMSGKLSRWLIVVAVVSAPVLIVLAFSLGGVGMYGEGGNHDGISVFGFELALSGRLTIWLGLISALNTENAWLTGFGLDGFFGTSMVSYISDIGLGEFIPNDAHNGYIDLILTFGITGFAIYMYLLALVIRRSTSGRMTREKAFFLTFLFVYVISNLTESFFVKTSNITSFLFFCLLIYSGRFRGMDSEVADGGGTKGEDDLDARALPRFQALRIR